MKNYDIIIVGGGIVGLTLAAALAEHDLKIVVLDQQAPPCLDLIEPYDLRVSAINLASQKIFQSLNVWDTIKKLRCSSYKTMTVWDKNSPAHIDFSSQDIGKTYLGHIIEQSVLKQALWQRLSQDENVQLMTEQKPVALVEAADHAAIKLGNELVLRAPLIVGADGGNSWVAAQAGLPIKTSSYQQSALVTTVHVEHSHQHTAWQRFLDHGTLAFLPLADEQLVSIVWSTTPQHALALQALDEADFNRELTNAFERRLGEVKVIDKRMIFPLTQRHASHYVKPRIALIGDAAHTIHPLAGQGVNLGILDAICLAEVLEQTLQRQGDLGGLSTLRRYERWRKGENTLMITAMRSFKLAFTHQNELLRHVRTIGFAMANKIPYLKTQFMQRAMGLKGDLPKRALNRLY